MSTVKPCTKAISVADINKFLNLALAQGTISKTVQAHYKLLLYHVFECGACEKMKLAIQTFGE